MEFRSGCLWSQNDKDHFLECHQEYRLAFQGRLFRNYGLQHSIFNLSCYSFYFEVLFSETIYSSKGYSASHAVPSN